MIFQSDLQTNRTIATIPSDGHSGAIEYDCSFRSCPNPVCACNVIDVGLSPLIDASPDEKSKQTYQIEIDLIEKKLSDGKKLPENQLKFAQKLISMLDDEDYKILNMKHFDYKNRISKEAEPDSIDMEFDFQQVEKDGLMYAYNDVLPYGDYLKITLDDKRYTIFDQYCLLPKCPCTDVMLTVFSSESAFKPENELGVFALTYKSMSWKVQEEGKANIKLENIKTALKEQLPTFDKLLQERHIRLKKIYSACKKKYFNVASPVESMKIGRNEPCPCGSGKKYKKCCLKKE